MKKNTEGKLFSNDNYAFTMIHVRKKKLNKIRVLSGNCIVFYTSATPPFFFFVYSVFCHILISNNIKKLIKLFFFSFHTGTTGCKCCTTCKAKMDTHTFLLETVIEKLSALTESTDFQPDESTIFDRMFADQLPLNSRDELLNFEEMLRQNPSMKQCLIRRLSLVGGHNERLATVRIIDMFFSPKCLQQMCWVGTAEKGSFRSLLQILEVLNLSARKAFPDSKVPHAQVVESLLRSKFKNAEAKVLSIAKKDVAQMLSGNITTKHFTEY